MAARSRKASSDLDAYFRSEDGRALLSRTQDAESVNVIETLVEADQFMIHASDTSTGAMEGVAQDYWRAYFDMGSRIATLSVFALQGETVTREDSLGALACFVAVGATGQFGRRGTCCRSAAPDDRSAGRRAAGFSTWACFGEYSTDRVPVASGRGAHTSGGPGGRTGPWDSNSPGFLERLGLGQSLKRWRRALQSGGLSAAELRAMLSEMGPAAGSTPERGGADGAVVPGGRRRADDQRHPVRLVRAPRRVARSDAAARDRRSALAHGASRGCHGLPRRGAL
jgi:hypothetical protein